jgi:hypothetical protein
MKILFVLFLIPFIAFADDLGRVLKPRIKNGAPDFWVRYSMSKSKVELDFFANIDSSELDNLPTMVEGFFIDTSTKMPASHRFLYWNGAIEHGYFFTDNEQEGANILKNFKNLGVAFRTEEGKPLYWIPIGEFCRQYPKLFFNVDENREGCPSAVL